MNNDNIRTKWTAEEWDAIAMIIGVLFGLVIPAVWIALVLLFRG